LCKVDGRVSITVLDRLVLAYGRDHELAVMLWETGAGRAAIGDAGYRSGPNRRGLVGALGAGPGNATPDTA